MKLYDRESVKRETKISTFLRHQVRTKDQLKNLIKCCAWRVENLNVLFFLETVTIQFMVIWECKIINI